MPNTTRLKMWTNERYAHDAVCRGLSTRTNDRSRARFVGHVAHAEPQQSKKESFGAYLGTGTLRRI